MITLPSPLKISKVLSDLGRPLGERYLLIISNLYVRGLLRKKTTGRLGNFLTSHWTLLRQMGGEKYRTLIDYGTKEKHIIKSPKSAIPGVQSHEYRLNQEVLPLNHQQRYVLTTVASRKVRQKYLIDRRNKFADTSEAHRKIVQSIEGLTFNYEQAFQYVAGLPDGEKKDHRRNILGLFLTGETDWSTDKQGRNYTLMVSVPRDLRRFFSHENHPLWVVDISSSQPLLHLNLYSNDCDEKKKYRSIVEGGEFWDFMNEASGGTVDLTDPDERAEFKTQVFRQVFYSYSEVKNATDRVVASAFEKEFPILWGEIQSTKRLTGPKQSGPLAKEMQRIEAEAVSEAVVQLKDQPYPVITIHDAIVTTQEGVEDVKRSITKSFEALEVIPPLSTKRLTFTPTAP